MNKDAIYRLDIASTATLTEQLAISLQGMNGGAFEVKALVKFTGPRFFTGSTSTEPDEIRIARVVYVPVD